MSDRDAEGLIVCREKKPFVRRALGAGKVDYLDTAERSFAFLTARLPQSHLALSAPPYAT